MGSARGAAFRLCAGDRILALSIALAAALFGGVVVHRSAFLERRRTDFGVYAVAAWAIRAGADPYAVVDANGWHYCYPIPFAMMVAPLADPPPGSPRGGMLPFAVSTAIWYLASVCLLLVAVDAFAAAMEPSTRDRGDSRTAAQWWRVRLWALLLCLPPIGLCLARGQIGTLLLALVCLSATFAARKRPHAAGVFLGAAASLKVIPTLLLVYPLWKRDGRFVVGAVLGAAALLVAIPAATLGLGRTCELHRRFVVQVLLPGVGAGADATMTKELTGAGATRSQSFQSALHRLVHAGTWPASPPETIAVWTRALHWCLSLSLLASVLALASRSGRVAAERDALAFASLMLLMILASPVCHLHYLVFGIPSIIAISTIGWRDRGFPRISPWLRGILISFPTITGVILLPGMRYWQDMGAGGAACLVLLFTNLSLLASKSPSEQALRQTDREVIGRAA